MKPRTFLLFFILLFLILFALAKESTILDEKSLNQKPQIDKKTGFNILTKDEKYVILDKGTEKAFTGRYHDFKEEGVYHCKQCNEKLFNSSSKFDSGTGWPSFDEAIEGKVEKVKDADGQRVEIICHKCKGHLGHVFENEGFTEKNARYCVNSISLTFSSTEKNMKKAYFAGGCFWGMEHLMQKQQGVTTVVSGFMGGKAENPSYQDVCSGKSGHIEVVEVNYDPHHVSYETLTKLFFEIHDPTQKDGQGPDIGEQYISAIFTSDQAEKETANKLIQTLKDKGFDVATQIREEAKFYPAEDYHQDYYVKHKKEPYCHKYTKRFD